MGLSTLADGEEEKDGGISPNGWDAFGELLCSLTWRVHGV